MPAKPIFTEEQFETLRLAANRVFNRHFKGHSPKPQVKMALAIGISQQSVSKLLTGDYRPSLKVATEIAILDGKEDLEDLIGEFAKPNSGGSVELGSYANLEICVQFHSATKQWSPWTIAAARHGFFGPTDFAPPEWPDKLDHLEKALERAKKMAT
jgi:DNA-binding XRE family transcriptional regulator